MKILMGALLVVVVVVGSGLGLLPEPDYDLEGVVVPLEGEGVDR